MVPQSPQYKLVWQYLDQKCTENQPANFKDFLGANPQFKHDTYNKAAIAWRRQKKGDPIAMKWSDGVRLRKDTIAEEVRNYLDQKFAQNAPATSADSRKTHPKITTSTFNLVAMLWEKSHASDPIAMKWYSEVRLGKLDRAETRRRGIP